MKIRINDRLEALVTSQHKFFNNPTEKSVKYLLKLRSLITDLVIERILDQKLSEWFINQTNTHSATKLSNQTITITPKQRRHLRSNVTKYFEIIDKKIKEIRDGSV